MSGARSLDPARLESAARSDVGMVRSANQDSVGERTSADGDWRVFVVADGMGGHAGGETASRLAVEKVTAAFCEGEGPVDARLRAAVEAANREVYEAQLRDASLHGMGTTGVAIGVGPEGAWVANVGDSRAYRLRSGTLSQLTRDHSVVAELERRGFITSEQAATHPRRNEVLRSLGTEARVEVDVDPLEVGPEDLFLLCSDGLCGVVPDPEVASLLSLQPLEAAADALVEAAREHGAPDNVTVQIVRVPAAALAGTGVEEGQRSWSPWLLGGALLLGLAAGWILLGG